MVNVMAMNKPVGYTIMHDVRGYM